MYLKAIAVPQGDGWLVPMMLMNVIMLAAAYIYASLRCKSGRVKLEISYESK